MPATRLRQAFHRAGWVYEQKVESWRIHYFTQDEVVEAVEALSRPPGEIAKRSA